ncbi:MAG: BMP family lipoprotein [Acidimicrobiales bacterium]
MHKKHVRLLIALLAVFAFVAAACGDDDDDATGGTGTTADGGGDGGAGADFKACEITDTGGPDDDSFNETAANGLLQAEDDLGIEQQIIESQSESDFAPNIQAAIDAECDLVVTVGFLLGDATAEAAEANPDQNFAIVDFAYEDPYDNIRQLTFATDQAAFLAGYLAAGMTETGTVGTYGGINIPTVNIFMKGFQAGIDFYNEEKGTEVSLEGWSNDTEEGLFTGDFEDQTKGRNTTRSLLDAGADIILPVAGPVGLGTIEEVKADGGGAKVIWVDTDGCFSVPDDCDVFLTSVQKRMDVAVFDTIGAAVGGEFEGGIYSGTLENDGVGIADYQEFEDEVPQELKDEIEDLRQQIIDGDIDTNPTD